MGDNHINYRVAGILLRNNKILLQKPTNDASFAVPGGQAKFGETGAQTLSRRFKEETNIDITVGDLKWVEEVFFVWDDKPQHIICHYYDIALQNETQLPNEDSFISDEYIEGRNFQLKFHWIPLDDLEKIKVYPVNIADLMKRYREGIQYFVNRENI